MSYLHLYSPLCVIAAAIPTCNQSILSQLKLRTSYLLTQSTCEVGRCVNNDNLFFKVILRFTFSHWQWSQNEHCMDLN